MEIDIIEVEVKLQLLAMSFSNTFFKSVADKYQVVFETSNVIDEMDALDELSIKVANRSQTRMIKKDSKLLESILEYYTYLISVYKTLANVNEIPIKLKRYDMIKYLQDWCKKTSGEELMNWGKGFVDEVLNSDMAVKIDALAERINPTMSEYMTKEERMIATVDAEIAKILSKK
jgi:hypothetical protein